MSKMKNYMMDVEEFVMDTSMVVTSSSPLMRLQQMLISIFGQPWRVTMLVSILKHNWEKCNYCIE